MQCHGDIAQSGGRSLLGGEHELAVSLEHTDPTPGPWGPVWL